MYHFIQRNKKKMLAVFGVLLMIVFILPTTGLNPGGNSGAEIAYGYIGDRTITRGEVAEARSEWDMLQRQMTYLPAAGQFVPYVYHLGPVLAGQINQQPDLYFLLQEEAKQLGLNVSDERVNEVIGADPFLRPQVAGSVDFQRAMKGFLTVQAYVDRLASNVKPSEPLVQRTIASATQQVSLNIAELTADQLKPTGAIPDAELQAHFAKYVRSAATAPATTGPATTTAADALAFDYRFPDRVKFQYLAVDAKQLRDLVRKTRDEFQWDVAAQKYYLQHQDEFPPKPAAVGEMPLPPFSSTPAASQPATAVAPKPDATKPEMTKPDAPKPDAPKPEAPKPEAPKPAAPKPDTTKPDAAKPADPAKPAPAGDETELEPRPAAPADVEGDAVLAADVQPASKPVATQPATATAPAIEAAETKPTVRPFAEVKEEILQKVMEPQVQALGKELGEKIAKRLSTDFAAHRKEPAVAQAGAYPTSEYLERVAGEIEKEHKIRPTVVSKANDWTPVNELSGVAGIGSASAAGDRFADVARQVDALGGATLKLLEFARPLTDPSGSVYLVRFTAAEKSHEPASLADVKASVDNDLRIARGYAAAKEAADKILAEAKQRGLPSAAAAGKAKFVTTGLFDRRIAFGQGMFLPIPGYEDANPLVKGELVMKAYELLDQASAANPNPRAILELPTQRKFLVIELADTNSMLQPSESFQAGVQVRRDLVAQAAQGLAAEYLTYDAVKSRLGFRLDEPEEEQSAGPEAAAR